jgi:starch phosphorylase
MSNLFDRHLSPDWRDRISDPEMWKKAASLNPATYWQIKDDLRAQMIHYVRWRLDEQHSEMYTRSDKGRQVSKILDPDTLTIGFARRFATYKRATLLLRDRERAIRLFTHPERPVQFVIAGRAHCLYRRLRYGRSTPDGAGLRYLAEHTAPPAGSIRHQRDESSH